jgi:hypothetical protein
MNKFLLGIVALFFVFFHLSGVHLPYHQDEYKWKLYSHPEIIPPGTVPHPPLTEFIYTKIGPLVGDENFRFIPFSFGLINLILLYFLVKYLYGEKTAVISSIIFTFSFYSLLASLMVDVDFENDAARIYIAMDTDIDGNFGKQLPKLNDGVDVAVVDTGAAIIVKSDHTRVISRVDGTIRIIKEGDENDENGTGRAVILMEKDGTTIIDSPKIIIGSGIEKDNGAGTQVYIGRDATEPLVMGDTLKKLLGDYTTAVEKHITTFANALETAGNELASPPNSLGNLGVALPGIKRLSDMLKSASPQLKSDVSDATKQLNDNINSMFSRIGRVR